MRPFLVVAVDEPEWGLQAQLPRLARERGHPLAARLEVAIDRGLEQPFRGRLGEFGAVLFLAQDPLGPLYPQVYGYALELERACAAAGVPLLGRAEPLSRTCKTRQLLQLRRAGLRAPRAVRLAHWRDALAGDRVPFPLVLRYDCGHDADDEGFAGPFRTPRELLAARLPQHGGWPARRHLAGLAAVEFIDVRSPDDVFRRYRLWAAGESVFRGHLVVAGKWYGHETENFPTTPYRDEMTAFVRGEATPAERELALTAARALELDVTAIDYSYDADGNAVVWEANAYPGVSPHWGRDPIFQRRFVEALAALLERTAAGGQVAASSATA